VQLHYACGVVAIAIPSKTQQPIAIDLSFSFSTRGRSLFWNKSKSTRVRSYPVGNRPFSHVKMI